MCTEAQLFAIAESIRSFGEMAYGSEPVLSVAEEWADYGFEDWEDVEMWLDAGVFTPKAADELKTAGITVEHANIVDDSICGYSATTGYKFANGDMSICDVKEAIANDE